MPRLDNKIAIVDIETTGPNIDEGDRILQIGAIIISNGHVVNTYTMLINPERDIPDHIVKLTGIEDKDVANAPKFQSVASLWYERLKDCIFIAHNLGFDLRILKESFARFNLNFSPIALDSVILSKILLPTAKGFNLTDLSQHFNFDYNEAHDALSDALITADIINKLARKVLEIPSDTLDQMAVFIKQMKHDELLFFTQPELFMLNAELHDYLESPRVQSNGIEDKTKKIMSEFIDDEWSKNPHLVVEDSDKPIPNRLIFNQVILNSQEKYILSFPNLDELNFWANYIQESYSLDIALLKSSNHYLYKAKFDHYIKHYNFVKGNQQELLVIAATIHWLSQTKFADYSELNKELSIKSLLDKHDYFVPNKPIHKNFELARQHAMNYRILLTNDLNLLSIVKNSTYKTEFIFNRKLIIMNLSSLYSVSQYYTSAQVEISGLISLIMSIYDEINQLHSREDTTILVNRILQSMKDQTHSVIDIISLLFDEEMDYEESHKQDEVDLYLDLESIHAIQILNFLKHIQSKLMDLKKIINKEKDSFKLIGYRLSMIQKFIDILKNILSDNNTELFIIINATRINGKYYNIQISQKSVVINEHQLNWMDEFSQVLLISAGNYYNQQLSGQSTWLNLPVSYKYIKLPSLNNAQSYPIYFPSEYVQSSNNNERLFDLINFITKEKEKISGSIIILFPNQDLVVEGYKQFVNNGELSTDYHIFAQSITGSLNRIRRRLNETDNSIVILREKTFTQLFWEDNCEETTVILFNLPFDSPENIDIQAKFNFMQKEHSEFQLFDNLLLPQMTQRLKELMHYTNEHYSNNLFYIFDNRLYSKYYSKSIIDEITPMIEIEIK
ncbi:exonuclease domain-containing protein [Aerococcaceae bacterium WGS1372]